ncbi:major capsid protein [Shinella sp. H4-D48]|uniref:major capsid protein n=1 Tax=Shinella sp. H4-D48 TaxID=2925841 RepID=UPI001F52EFD2|nr:major capsid protein [Shinella sp. H4-D48]UNK36568.1 major capsid protein [Shinella sp. H4-D48]
MTILNVFKDDAFGVTSLTDAINEIEYRPSRIEALGLFEEKSVSTTSVSIERIGDALQLVPPTPRGGKGDVKDNQKRSMKNLTVPHFLREWSVIADEIQNVRKFGSESELETVMSVVLDKVMDNMSDLEVTNEYSRLGAVQGVVTYADATSLNLFTEFGVTQAAEVDFDLDNANPAEGILRKACTGIIRATRTNMGGSPFSYVHAFVGDTFFDQLISHAEVRETYKGWSEAQILRDSYVGPSRAENPIFTFGGIVFENYGAVAAEGDGTKLGVESTKAKFFPVGARGMFKSYYAPAPYMETVNTLGKKYYAKQEALPMDKGVYGETQTNALHICTRPAALLRAKNT